MSETATEWGPARHDPQDPRSHVSLEADRAASFASWDAADTRHDDN